MAPQSPPFRAVHGTGPKGLTCPQPRSEGTQVEVLDAAGCAVVQSAKLLVLQPAAPEVTQEQCDGTASRLHGEAYLLPPFCPAKHVPSVPISRYGERWRKNWPAVVPSQLAGGHVQLHVKPRDVEARISNVETDRIYDGDGFLQTVLAVVIPPALWAQVV